MFASHKPYSIIHVYYSMDCIVCLAARCCVCVCVSLLPHHSHTTCIHNTQSLYTKHIETRAGPIGPISNSVREMDAQSRRKQKEREKCCRSVKQQQ